MQFNQSEPGWNDWKWQHAKSCKDLNTLRDWVQSSGYTFGLSSDTFEALIDNYRMGITPYYYSLIKTFSASDPIYRQIIPLSQELNITTEEKIDPISDENPGRGSRPLKALIHRYPNRVLLLPTAQCAVYCRFCFRKRLVGDTTHNARGEDLEQAFSYIKEHPEIEEVILTGGDPLTLGDQAIHHIIKNIEQIKHIRLIRIHTRLPVVNPYRLTPELGEIIASGKKPIWISAHFNHPQEITSVSSGYIQSWIKMGIPFLNQSVLLRGVNDSAKTLKKLFMDLISIKVKPYYLHQADLVQGTSHLRVPIEEGLQLIKELQGEIPGYAMPHYVLDRPGGIGKIPLQNPYK